MRYFVVRIVYTHERQTKTLNLPRLHWQEELGYTQSVLTERYIYDSVLTYVSISGSARNKETESLTIELPSGQTVLTEQQEFELSPGVPLVTPQLSFDLLVDALLFLGLLRQATRHFSGDSSSTLRPGPPRRRKTVGCRGASVITCCAVHPPYSAPPPPPPTRPAAADTSCHSTVTRSAPCLTKNAQCVWLSMCVVVVQHHDSGRPSPS